MRNIYDLSQYPLAEAVLDKTTNRNRYDAQDKTTVGALDPGSLPHVCRNARPSNRSPVLSLCTRWRTQYWFAEQWTMYSSRVTFIRTKTSWANYDLPCQENDIVVNSIRNRKKPSPNPNNSPICEHSFAQRHWKVSPCMPSKFNHSIGSINIESLELFTVSGKGNEIWSRSKPIAGWRTFLCSAITSFDRSELIVHREVA